jgi:hypothetical protein
MTGNNDPMVHAQDKDIFVPASIVSSQVKLPGPLQDPYLNVRASISRTHESVREMWGAVFEFAVECRKHENQDAVKQICDRHAVIAKPTSSSFNPAVKIAIGSPRYDEETSKIVFDFEDVQVTRFCKVFDFAYAHLTKPTVDNFLSWLDDTSPKGGGGSISECLIRAVEWANKDKFPGGKADDDVIFDLRLGKLRAANKGSYDGLFAKGKDASSFGLEDGKHYSMVLTLEAGVPVVDAVEEVEDDAFKNSIKSNLPQLEEDEKPLTLSQLFKAIGKHGKTAENVDVEIVDDIATINCSTKDGPITKSHKLYPGKEDMAFSVSASALTEIKRSIPVFKEGLCVWSLSNDAIEITLPKGSTAPDLERKYNAGQKKKISLGVEFVKYRNRGKLVSILFQPKGKKS